MNSVVGRRSTGADPAHAESDVDLAVGDPNPQNLRQTTVYGAVVSTVAQAIGFAVRMGSMIVLARLLVPRDFGLVGMVAAFTGFLGLFRDVGLSMATIQRSTVTRAQTSTLFWINLGGGGVLAGLCCIGAPILVHFYGEPRLFWIAVVMGVGFVFNGAGAQHRAMLQRAMRFRSLAWIDTISLVLGIVIAIAAAVSGAGYWSIVVMTITPPVAGAVGVWLALGWIPGRPRRGAEIRAMLWFGGTITLNSVVMYLAYNVDKVLIGRVWGPEALGIYGRAYQLMNLPTENLNYTVGVVAFPALSRVQQEPRRLREYFLKGYGLFLSLSIPITAVCFLFSEDIVRVLLGPNWSEAASVFRLLTPTIFVLACINPLAWLMLAVGHATRSLKIALVIAPVIILGYVLGLGEGPTGVAIGFSSAMLLLLVPVVMWATHGTPISARDIGWAIVHPLMAVVAGAAVALAMHAWTNEIETPILRLMIEAGALFGVYAIVLLWVFDQRARYLPLLREVGLWRGPA